MKSRFFLLLSFVLVTLCLSAQSLVFHLPNGSMTTVTLPATFTISPSGDKIVIESNSTRVELEKNRILAMIYRSAKGDVNDDQAVDVADIATVIDIMSGKGGETEPDTPEDKDYTFCPDNHHPHSIDLGLPSGTKWACCNLGASTPEGYGDYYAWGETQPKSVYDWDSYQYWHDYDGDGYIDRNEKDSIGFDIAGTGYDAATVNWGGPWRIPSIEQCEELEHNTTSTCTTQNGVYGIKITGSNGGTIFLPAAGYRWGGELIDVDTNGRYFLSEIFGETNDCSSFFYFNGCNISSSDGVYRSQGNTLRPVR